MARSRDPDGLRFLWKYALPPYLPGRGAGQWRRVSGQSAGGASAEWLFGRGSGGGAGGSGLGCTREYVLFAGSQRPAAAERNDDRGMRSPGADRYGYRRFGIVADG
ncbi:hypothetical protein D3C76_1488270 [compost metagenome]